MLAIISDIHGNLEALNAVLDDIRQMKATEIICLGDLVGYGPNPLECVQHSLAWDIVLRGNFDHAMTESDCDWPQKLRQMMERIRVKFKTHQDGEHLIQFLENIPSSFERDDILFVHGSPRDHVNEYVFPEHIYDRERMQSIFEGFSRLCFCGHSHIPGVYYDRSDAWIFEAPDQIDYVYRAGKTKTLINVGSVGQPRDGDPRACYVLVDKDVIVFRRVDYDYETTIKKIRDSDDDDDMDGDRLLVGG